VSDVVQLSPEDNIVVLVRSVAANEVIDLSGESVRLPETLGLGHKLALRAIGAGEKIFKYGVPIGSATRDIARGEHVHLQNMQSDYIPTYTLEEGREFGGRS